MITTDADGYFSLVAGTGTRSDTANISNPLLTFDKVQQNHVALVSAVPSGGDGTATGSSCSYTPAAGAGRRVFIAVTADTTSSISTISSWDSLGNILVYPAANAISAESVAGIDSTKIMSVSTGAAPVLTSTQSTELIALVNGSSTKYATSAANSAVSLPGYTSGTPPATPVAGSIWYDTTNNEVKFYNGSSAVTLGNSGHPAFSGDVSATANSGVLTLTASGVTAGTYGSATQIPQFTVDTKGRLTSAVNIAASATPSGTASGDLSGSYPSPTVSKIQGYSVSTTAPTSSQTLIFNGTNWQPARMKYNDLINNIGTNPWPSPCSSYQSLSYSSIGDSFTCMNIIGGSSHGIADGGNTPTANLSIGTLNAYGLDFKTSGTNQMTLSASGKLGLGTSNPVDDFIIHKSSNSASITLSHDGSGATQKSMLNLETYNPSAAIIGTTGVKGWQLYTNSNGFSPTIAQNVFGISFWNGPSEAKALEINPAGAIEIKNTLVQHTNSVATTTVDFSTANLQYTTQNCGAFQLYNMREGGSYTFAVNGTTSATCSFSAFSGAGTGALTVNYPPDHGPTIATKKTLYSFLVLGNEVFVSWVPGY